MSRDLNDLDDLMKEKAEKLMEISKDKGFDILIYCTFRPLEEQAKLYRRGRPLPQIQNKAEELKNRWNRPDLADLLMDVGPQFGSKVTFAGPGQSMHNYRFAFDAVPIAYGKAVWGTAQIWQRELWKQYGEIGVSIGLEWAGNWTRFREFPHMQLPGKNWRELIQS